MLFWILLGICAALIIWVIVYNTMNEDGIAGLLLGFIAAIGAGIVLGLYSGAVALWWNYPYNRSDERVELRALATDDTIKGRFYFLGSGYIGSERTFNYIAQRDGYATAEREAARDSRIFEDTTLDDGPYVIEYKGEWGNPWLIPFNLGTFTMADFHIPEGSILVDYTVRND